MLSCQTRTEIVTRSKSLGISEMQLRLKAEEVLGKMVPNIDCLAEDEGQRVGDEIELILRNRRANLRASAAHLGGASVGGSRLAELEAQP